MVPQRTGPRYRRGQKSAGKGSIQQHGGGATGRGANAKKDHDRVIDQSEKFRRHRKLRWVTSNRRRTVRSSEKRGIGTPQWGKRKQGWGVNMAKEFRTLVCPSTLPMVGTRRVRKTPSLEREKQRDKQTRRIKTGRPQKGVGHKEEKGAPSDKY